MLTNPIKVNSLIKSAGKAFGLDTGGVPVADFLGNPAVLAPEK